MVKSGAIKSVLLINTAALNYVTLLDLNINLRINSFINFLMANKGRGAVGKFRSPAGLHQDY